MFNSQGYRGIINFGLLVDFQTLCWVKAVQVGNDQEKTLLHEGVFEPEFYSDQGPVVQN